MKSIAACMAALLAACGGSPSWQSAVDDAKEADEPLIIEFYADWCQPCKWFEANVLPRDDVAAELSRVTFRRIDFDSTAGRHHARRLGVRGVPTFVAIDERGEVVGGLRGAAGAERFLQFLRWSQQEKAERGTAAGRPPTPPGSASPN